MKKLSIDKKRIEKLTKIKIEEESDFFYDLRKLKDGIRKQYEREIHNTLPLFHSSDINGFLRKDTIGKSLGKCAVMRNARANKEGYFISKKSITDYERGVI